MKRQTIRAITAISLACAALIACSGEAARTRATGRRDVDELQRLRRDPRACGDDADCPVGSHCDAESDRCTWACLADSECGSGSCDLRGACVATASLTANLANDSAGCQAIPAAERRAALLALADNAQQGDFITCDSDATCPCGAHCSADAVCQVDCLADNPTPALSCGTGQACTALGRCAASSSDPGPPLALTIALSELVTRANTAAAPVVVPLTVTVSATSFEVLQAQNPAVVKLGFAELRDFEQGRVATAPSPAPRVKCAPGDALANSCELRGWTFDVAAGELRSAPRTIWVELPQTLVAQSWTLEARSEWAADPAFDVIEAAPVLIPATDPGRYTGSLVIDANDELRLPVEAIVTPTHVALLEPSRVVLPDGHAVLARAPGKATLLSWLTNGSARYDVALTMPALAYDPATGRLHLTINAATGTGAAATTLTLELERTGDVDAPQCPATACGAGSYCDAAIGRCLAGSGPAAGGGIVDAASAIPSSVLPSAEVAAWAAPLATVAAGNAALLGGGGAAGVERAYCFEAPTQPGPARFAIGSTLQPVSADLACSRGGAAPSEYPQPTFKFADLDREYDSATHVDLFETCLNDLSAQPTGVPTAANLLNARGCASLGRFFLALNANAPGGVGQPLVYAGQRWVGQLLRQWLGVHAYIASSAIQVRQYDDALSASSAPAHERLGTAVDVLAQGLGVLIDPRVRPQYATGPHLAQVETAPDYRVAARPVVRWTFNEMTSPVPDAEATNALITQGVDLSTRALVSTGAAGARAESTQLVALDDRRFTIAMALSDVDDGVVFEKVAPNGDRLWIETSSFTTSPGTDRAFVMTDSAGRSVRFEVPWQTAFPPYTLIAFVADNGVYRLFGGFGGAPMLILGGGPRWGAPGIVRLAGAGTASTCTSWDRNVAGDGLDVTVRAPFATSDPPVEYSCTTRRIPPRTQCTGVAPTDPAACPAATKRAQLLAALLPNPPAAAVNALAVQGHATVVYTDEQGTPASRTVTTGYQCDYTVTNLPAPVTGPKPVCGTESSIATIDEVSLWDHAIQGSEFVAIKARYDQAPRSRSNEILPPRLEASTPPGTDQAVGLPVHIVEAASADLDLLAAYIDAERGVMYEECYLGGGSPARDRVAARAGTHLRLISILEGEAAHLAALPGASSTPWYARYQAGRRELAGRRIRAVKQLQLAGACRNPLGIAEENLPLFVGEEVGPSSKFFASSRFLTSKAREEIGLAQGKLGTAQAKYVEARQSAYQLNVARESKALRDGKLRADYESALRKVCGTPWGTQKLLDGFLAGTTNASTCFFKTEVPGCQNLTNTPIAELPASCLRGDIGARLLAIQSANIDMANANANLVRATEQYDSDQAYCARRQAALELDETILENHNHLMSGLREVNRSFGLLFGIEKSISSFGSNNVLGATSLADVGIQSVFDTIAEAEQAERERFEALMQRRSHALDIAECYHRADNDKFAIDAARDVITRGAQEVTTALFNLDNDRNALAGLVDEAAGQLALEATIDSTPPHLHFWLDAEITEYHRHLEYARRLTYLALRAFEYEAQQSIGHRGDTLTARRPDNLLAVVTAIEQRNAPMQGELGLVIGARPVVLSLRDEILRILDVSASPNRLPGEPALTPEQALKAYLASESSRILGADGRYLGRGIRFALRPAAWSETSCAERIWRITPSLQIDNPPTQHGLVLYQDNAFGSQDCRADFGAVTVSRAESSVNLLVGDTATFARPSSFTAMNIDGPLGLDHETLRARPEGDLAGFAGRGLYGNYVLLFPPQTWPDAQIAKVKDLLLRFDIVELSHPPAL